MKTLDEIFVQNNTDKGSKHTTALYPHNYGSHYERWFAPLRESSVKMIEIGVGGGESIQSWLDYFKSAQVVGVDISGPTNRWNTGRGDAERYTFVRGDQSSSDFWRLFLNVHGDNWDIVIDDGSHINVDIITTFLHLWPALKPGGLYCIEDLGAAYGTGSVFIKAGLPSQNDFLRSKIDELHQGGDIESMYFAKELCILKKRL